MGLGRRGGIRGSSGGVVTISSGGISIGSIMGRVAATGPVATSGRVGLTGVADAAHARSSKRAAEVEMRVMVLTFFLVKIKQEMLGVPACTECRS